MNAFHMKTQYPQSLNPFDNDERFVKCLPKESHAEYPNYLNPFDMLGDIQDDNGLKLFMRVDIRHASHLLSDVQYWINYYKTMAVASYSHSKALKKVVSQEEEYIKKEKDNGLSCKEEAKLFQEIDFAQKRLHHQADTLKHDGDVYTYLAKELKMYKDDKSLKVAKLDAKYRKARETLDKETKVVDEKRKAYHKAKQGEELLSREAECYSADKLRKLKERLQVKSLERYGSYRSALQKWQIKLEHAQKLSVELRKAYISREVARANTVHCCLLRNIDMFKCDSNNNSLARDLENCAICDISSVIENICRVETVNIPILQEYKCETESSDMGYIQTTMAPKN